MFVHQRFEKHVAPPNEKGCRLWTGIVKAERGMFLLSTRPHRWISAAKWAYQFYVEPVPQGFYVLSRCGQPLCMEHLRLKSRSDVMKAAVKRGFRPQDNLANVRGFGRGLENPRGKYSDEFIKEVHDQWKAGMKIEVIGMRRGLATSTVWSLCERFKASPK